MGTVGLWHADEQPDDEVYLVGHVGGDASPGAPASATSWCATALAHAAASGWRRVLLDVAHENARARRFYARMGFARTGDVGAMPWDPSVTEETLALDLPVGA